VLFTRYYDYMARIVPDNPTAFPPSMAVRRRRYEPMDGRRYDSRDGGGRATHGAVTEGAKTDDYRARTVWTASSKRPVSEDTKSK